MLRCNQLTNYWSSFKCRRDYTRVSLSDNRLVIVSFAENRTSRHFSSFVDIVETNVSRSHVVLFLLSLRAKTRIGDNDKSVDKEFRVQAASLASSRRSATNAYVCFNWANSGAVRKHRNAIIYINTRAYTHYFPVMQVAWYVHIMYVRV